jgi:uncharacterized repeat protein (TIGR03803 family)
MKTAHLLFSRKFSFRVAPAIVLAAFAAAAGGNAQAKEKVIHYFTGWDGNGPTGSLTLDAFGDIYGTTVGGGFTSGFCPQFGCGTVFRLSRTPDGGLKETVLHRFTGGPHDGHAPIGGVVFDAAGALYGAADSGGLHNWGAVFKLSPTAAGEWDKTEIYDFIGAGDGGNPVSGLIFDDAGNLYGTTQVGGGSGSYGTVFELSPRPSGAWSETVLHNFSGKDGWYPNSGLTRDADGNLYGTAQGGNFANPAVCGTGGCGVVYELSPGGGGVWTETVLYAFSAHDGAGPIGGVILDSFGNLYGTASYGGRLKGCMGLGCGVVYELSPKAGGWSETVIRTFEPGTTGFGDYGGAWPRAGLTIDASGNLYGTATLGGRSDCTFFGSGCGVVFKLSPGSTGAWKETVLHAIYGPANGVNPDSSLIFDATGHLLGSADYGGSFGVGCGLPGCGVLYEVTP